MKKMTEEQYIQSMIQILKGQLSKDYEKGKTRRDAHPKTLGLLKAKFKIATDIPPQYRIGIFKETREYPAIIRVSSSGNKVQGDNKKDLRGFSIKLLDVQGEKLLDDEKSTQDFVLISIETMPLGTVHEFHDAIYYGVKKKNPLVLLFKIIGKGQFKKIKQIVAARQHQTSPFDITYFSTTPYQFGEQAVKYCIRPTSNYKSQLPVKLTESYLSENMMKHLQVSPATFDFLIQVRKEDMPIEDASVRWSQEASPFVKMGEIVIEQQDFYTQEREELAERLSFSPGHSLRVHQPIGGINRARIQIYQELSRFRHERNDKKLFEPTLQDYDQM